MKKVDERIYLLTDLDGNEVCRLVIEQLASFGPPAHFANGRVVVTFLYGKNCNKFSENWGIDPLSNSPALRVRDFILPLDLRFKTVGTICWSLIYRTLPLQVRDSIQLSGLLSSADARIPKRDLHLARWRTWGKMSDNTEDNIVRRNRFWLRMLHPTTATLVCNMDGCGLFAGQFVDPVLTPGFVHKLVIHEISRSTFRAESEQT